MNFNDLKEIVILKKKKIVNFVFTSLIIGGFIGFSIGPACAFNLIKSDGIQLPPGDIQAVVTDLQGNTYYSDGFYSRIQAYDSAGRFFNIWHVDSAGGAIDMFVDDRGLLYVYATRLDMFYLYDKYGKMQSSQELIVDAFDAMKKTQVNQDNVVHNYHIPCILDLINPFLCWLYVLIGNVGYRIFNNKWPLTPKFMMAPPKW